MAKTKQIDKTTSDLLNVLDVEQNAILSRINCHGIGKIIEFDKSTQTASIQLMQVKQFENSYFIPSLLTEVPLIIYGTENASITLPDPVGTICLVFFMDRNIDAFIQTGEMYSPDTARMHDFTDCIAITTFKTLINPINDYDETAITLFYTKTIEEIAYTSIIKNYANSILLKTTDETSNASIELEVTNEGGISNANIELTANNSKIAVNNLITIQNNTQNLGNLIQLLIQTIKAITILNNQVSQTSKDALDGVAADFAALLQGIS